MGAIGLTASVAATTVAQRNVTALEPGEYAVEVRGAPCFILQGGADVAATTTNAERQRDGVFWSFTVVNHYDPTIARAFLSIRTESGTATVRVTRQDSSTATTALPAWA